MKRIAIPIAILAFSGIALAHPHKDDTPSETAKTERIWPYFGKKKQDKKDTQDSTEKSKTLSASDFASRLEKRFEKHADKMERSFKEAEAKNDFIGKDREIKNADDLREAARAIEDLISDSGVISGFADMMLDLAEDFDIETTDGRIKRAANKQRPDLIEVVDEAWQQAAAERFTDELTDTLKAALTERADERAMLFLI